MLFSELVSSSFIENKNKSKILVFDGGSASQLEELEAPLDAPLWHVLFLIHLFTFFLIIINFF